MPEGTSTQRPEDPDQSQYSQDDQSAAIAQGQQLAGSDRHQCGRGKSDADRTRFEVTIAAPGKIGEGQRPPDRSQSAAIGSR